MISELILPTENYFNHGDFVI